MPRRQASPSPGLERARASRASGGVSSRTSTITSASAAAAQVSAPAADLSSVSSQPDESDRASTSSHRSLSRGVPRVQVSVADFDTVFQGEALHSVGDVSSFGRPASLSFAPSSVACSTTAAMPTSVPTSSASPVMSAGFPTSAAAFTAWSSVPPSFLGHGFSQICWATGFYSVGWVLSFYAICVSDASAVDVAMVCCSAGGFSSLSRVCSALRGSLDLCWLSWSWSARPAFAAAGPPRLPRHFLLGRSLRWWRRLLLRKTCLVCQVCRVACMAVSLCHIL